MDPKLFYLERTIALLLICRASPLLLTLKMSNSFWDDAFVDGPPVSDAGPHGRGATDGDFGEVGTMSTVTAAFSPCREIKRRLQVRGSALVQLGLARD